jgi:hypothetical protein
MGRATQELVFASSAGLGSCFALCCSVVLESRCDAPLEGGVQLGPVPEEGDMGQGVTSSTRHIVVGPNYSAVNAAKMSPYAASMLLCPCH